MDISAALALASELTRWSHRADDIRAAVLQAQALSEIPGCEIAMIDEIGDDAMQMAIAVRQAAAELSAFSIELTSPASIVAAVGAIHSFSGGDNDPELDRRLRTLRGLVDEATSSDTQRSSVMRALLASTDPAAIAAAMTQIRAVNDAESSGAVSANDTSIDRAVRALQRALAGYSASEEHLDYLMAAFLADDGHTPAPLLLASLLTGHTAASIELAHRQGWEYDIAAGWLDAQQLDRLSAAIQTAPLPEIPELERQRSLLFARLSGVTDDELLAQFARRSNQGVGALDAIAGVQKDIRVAAIASEFGLDTPAAEVHLDYMTASTQGLIEQGFAPDDAAQVVGNAALAGRDIDPVVDLAHERGTTLIQAESTLHLADSLGLSLDELEALQGLQEHFAKFDTAQGGQADGLVSLADLRFVVSNYYPGNEAAMLAAAALLRTEDLRHRLDSAAQTTGVVGREPFGRTRAADNVYSLADVHLLIAKQLTNYALHDVVDEIDAAGDGGTSGWVDGKLSEFDFAHVRAHHAEYGLTPTELAAIDVVLENDWYDPTFWQEHSDSFVLGAAVVAGVLAGLATAGVGSGVVGALVSSAAGATAGATTGAGLTLAENALTGDPLTQDLVENSTRGAIGGLAGAGLYGYYAQPAGQSLAVRMVQVIGPAADTAGLVATGLVDPLLAPLIDDIELDALHDGMQMANYVGGAGSVANQPTIHAAVGDAVVRSVGVGLDVVPD